MIAGARILVATEVATDAEMVGKPLREEFDNRRRLYRPGGVLTQLNFLNWRG